jgi:hypothetical protein
MLDLWRDDKMNPKLCAWAVQWMKTILIPSIPEMQWIEVQTTYEGMPVIEDCNPLQLRKAAGWLIQCRKRHDEKQSAAAASEPAQEELPI